jgi:hypothetical protein
MLIIWVKFKNNLCKIIFLFDIHPDDITWFCALFILDIHPDNITWFCAPFAELCEVKGHKN